MKLSNRDLDILKYSYAMKFCTSDDVWKLFYESEEIDGKKYSKVRIKQLSDAGYLNVLSNDIYKKKIYSLSSKGLNIIREEFIDELFPRRLSSKPDLRNFSHDYYVALSRCSLERQELATNWISERQIVFDLMSDSGEYRSKYMLQNLRRSSIPDGLFRTRRGEVCAFELEYSLKSKRDLKEKLSVLHKESQVTSGLFERVLIVVSTNKIEGAVNSIKEELNASFKIIRLDSLLEFIGLKR